jgi:hypothetical protein
VCIHYCTADSIYYSNSPKLCAANTLVIYVIEIVCDADARCRVCVNSVSVRCSRIFVAHICSNSVDMYFFFHDDIVVVTDTCYRC